MRLVSYTPTWGSSIAAWVTSEEEMRWLAPGTPPPLTGEKITAWKKAGGFPLVGLDESSTPIAYGELNPMLSEAGHFWIGHLLVDPRIRGIGLGRQFIQSLLEMAFWNQQARRVSLVVFPENVAAVQCYRHCGFQKVGEENHRFLPGTPRYRLLRFEAGPSVVTSNKSQLEPVCVGH